MQKGITLNDLRRQIPWSRTKEVTAFPIMDKKVADLSHKEMARVLCYNIAEVYNLFEAYKKLSKEHEELISASKKGHQTESSSSS